MTQTQVLDNLGKAAAKQAMMAAADYIRRNGLRVTDYDAAVDILRATVTETGVGGALTDATRAFDAGMPEAAEATFRASMVLIGISAAKAMVAAGVAR